MYGWVCDFETLASNTEYTYVWAWGCYNMDNDDFQYGSEIKTFIEWCRDKQKLYFHNLGFDVAFIIDYLLRNDYKYVNKEDRKEGDTNTFYILKSKDNQVFMLDICWKYVDSKHIYTTKIYDSYKKLPFSVDTIAEDWKLPIGKLKIDYNAYREEGGNLTDEELAYLKNDVAIVAIALRGLLESGNDKMTIGADAYQQFLNTKTSKEVKKLFPIISKEVDEKIRKSYRGGFTYVNPMYANKDIGEGLVYDVNSLYPYVMYSALLPYGEPVYFEGEYVPSNKYPLYVAHVNINFELKPKSIPCIQIKNNPRFVSTEYLTSSKGDVIELWLTNIDILLIQQNYECTIEYIEGYQFQGSQGIFKDYIDKFMEIKKNSKGAKRQEAKLMLNNLYGKLATNPVRANKICYLDKENDIVKYELQDEIYITPKYIPMGTFITAYARFKTISTAQKLYDRFIYADTDSLHLIGTDEPDILDIDDKELGYWALEGKFTRGKYLRAKTYIEEIDNEIKVTCAGLPSKCHNQVTYENFKYGAVYTGKLLPKVVKGGIILKETEFKIQ